MFNKSKKKYAQFLFKKYGFSTGAFFERIPLAYKLCPLFSPSRYGCEEGRQIRERIMLGILDGQKMMEANNEQTEDVGTTADG